MTDVGRWQSKSEDHIWLKKIIKRIAGDVAQNFFLRFSRRRSKMSMAADGCLQIEDDFISQWSTYSDNVKI